MEGRPDRRKMERQTFDPPEIGILFIEGTGYESGTALIDPPTALYVDLLNRCRDGATVRTTRKIRPETIIRMLIYSYREKRWRVFEGMSKWITESPDSSNYYSVGVEIRTEDDSDKGFALAAECRGIPGPSDFEFFRQTKLLKSIPREALCPLLNSISNSEVKAGERFITQGDPGDACFIVQRGTCVAYVEKDQQIHTVGRLGEGDIVGEMAMLTGEPRSAHVEAETDMTLWSLGRRQFDEIVYRHPDLRNFLTELVTDRFAARKLIADRNIGKYVITDIIGKGGYSIVYKGLHSGLNMPVAIKMMKHDLAMDTEFLRKFRDEAKIIANLNHENIIKVYDIEELFRTVFIIMELAEGETIKELIQREKMIAYPRIINFLTQICNGLAYAHRHGIVHRDVKPSNMFVRSGDHVKLLDFGLACPTGSENVDFSGTIAFMSPEEINGEVVDQRSDIYALGLTTYEMLTGTRPFREDNLIALMNMHLSEDVPDPGEMRPDIPGEFREFVAKACAKDPARRYQSVEEALAMLSPLVGRFGLAQTKPTHETRRMTTMHLLYDDGQRLALKRLMEEFSLKAREIGIDLKAAEFQDI